MANENPSDVQVFAVDLKGCQTDLQKKLCLGKLRLSCHHKIKSSMLKIFLTLQLPVLMTKNLTSLFTFYACLAVDNGYGLSGS
jgi:hypothetical protein